MLNPRFYRPQGKKPRSKKQETLNQNIQKTQFIIYSVIFAFLGKQMSENREQISNLKNPSKMNTKYQRLTIRRIALICLSTYVSIGIIYLWLIGPKQQSTLASTGISIFLPIQECPVLSRIIIFVSLLFAYFPRVALLSSTIFFGQTVLLQIDNENSQRKWQFCLLAMTISILFLIISLVICYYEIEDRERARNQEVLMIIDDEIKKEKKQFDLFVIKVQDGRIQ